jgi:RNA polymerase sigma factor (sigma-70 family)
VTTIALNTARRRFRRQRPHSADPRDLLQDPDEAADVERDVDRARNREALLVALGELGEHEWEIVNLRYGSELDACEIARVLALAPANVRKILERTREQLGARLTALGISRGAIS